MNKDKLMPDIRFPEFKNEGEWEKKKLGDCLDYLQPTEFLVSSTAYDNSFKTPVLTAGKTFVLGYTNEVDNIFKEKLPVIIFDDFTTASQYVDFPFKAKSSAMKILLSKNNIDIKFSYELLQLINYEVGVHGRHWISVFSNLEVPVPENPKEQEKIASCLTSLDEVITAHSQKLNLLKDHKKGLMQNLFPQKGETVPKYRFREFEKDGDWMEKKLGELAELTSSKRVHLADYVSSGVPFFRGKEISQLKKNQFPDDILYISNEQYKEIRDKYGVPKQGDILITAVGTLGNVYCIKNDDEFYFKDGNLIWMKNIAINQHFLEILLDVEKEKVLASAIGSSQKALTMAALNKIEFQIPENAKEQQKIAECLSSLEAIITAQTEKIDKLKLHKKGLMQGLFPKLID